MPIQYKKYEFCDSVNCSYFWNEHCAVLADSDCSFTAKEFHKWLKANDFKISKPKSRAKKPKILFENDILNTPERLKIAHEYNPKYKTFCEAIVDLHETMYYCPYELGEIFGTGHQNIRYRLTKLNKAKKFGFRYYSEKHQIAKEMGYGNHDNTVHDCVVDQYAKLKSLRKVGKILDCSPQAIRAYMKKKKIPINPAGGGNNTKKKATPEQIQEIIESDKPPERLALKFGLSKSAVQAYRREAK